MAITLKPQDKEIFGDSESFIIAPNGQLWVNDGAENTPAFSFKDNTDAGMYFDITASTFERVNISVGGSSTLTAVRNQGSENAGIEINIGGSGDRNAYIDLRAADSQTDYSARIIRNLGADGGLVIDNKGTGAFSIQHEATNVVITSASAIRHLQQTLVSDGTAGSPGIGFDNDVDTGIFRVSNAIIGFTTDATERARITSAGLQVIDGSQANPSIAFTSDTDTGFFYNVANKRIGLAIDGTERFRFLKGTASEDTGFEININGSGARSAFIDFHGEDSVDFSARIIKRSAGDFDISNDTTGNLEIIQNATGVLQLTAAAGTGNIILNQAGTNDILFSLDGSTIMTMDGATDILHINTDVVFNSNSEAQKFYFGRQAGIAIPTNQFLSLGIADSGANWHLKNDEESSFIAWRIESTDTETGGGANASDYTLTLTGNASALKFESADLLIQAGAGSIANPTYSFEGDENTGFYQDAPDRIGVAAGGAEVLNFQSTGVRAISGSAASPSYSFISTSSTGMYSPASNELAFSTAGTQQLFLSSTGEAYFTNNIRMTGIGGQLAMDTDTVQGTKRLTWNDGGGNFNIRANSIYTTNEEYQIAGDGAVHIRMNVESQDADIIFRVADIAALAGDPITWANEVTIDNVRTYSTLPLHSQVHDASTPSFSFNGDQDTGMYGESGGGKLNFSVDGTRRFEMDTVENTSHTNFGVRVNGTTFTLQSLNDSNINVWFRNSTDTARGILWWDNAGETLGLQAYNSGGVAQANLRVRQDRITTNQPIAVQDGSAAVPEYTFEDDQDSGFYRAGADRIGLTLGGVLEVDFQTTETIFYNIIRSRRNSLQYFSMWSVDASGHNIEGFSDESNKKPIIIDNVHDETGSAAGQLDILFRIGSTTTPTEYFRLREAEADIRFQFPFRGEDGSAAAPTYSFTSETDLGFYRGAAGSLNWAAGGTYAGTLGADVTIAGDLYLQSGSRAIVHGGSNTLPSITFNGDLNTGIYSPAVDTIAFTVGGVWSFTIDTDKSIRVNPTLNYETLVTADDDIPNKKYVDDAITTAVAAGHPDPHLLGDGTAGAPTYSFSGDSDTGIYRSGTEDIGFAAGGNTRAIVTGDVGRTFDLLATTSGTSARVWQEWSEANGTRLAFAGVITDGNDIFYLRAEQGDLFLESTATGGDVRITTTDGVLDVRPDGTQSMLVDVNQVKVPDGTVGAPGLSFISDTNTGMYRIAADHIGFAVGGNPYMVVEANKVGVGDGFIASQTVGGFDFECRSTNNSVLGVTTTGATSSSYLQLEIANGDDWQILNTQPDASNLQWRFNGTTRLVLDTLGQFQAQDGTAGAPTYAFDSDTDSGMYLEAAGELAFAVGGSKELTLTNNVLSMFGDTTLPTTASCILEFNTLDGTRIGYVGEGSSSSDRIILAADTGDVRMIAAAQVRTVAGSNQLFYTSSSTIAMELETNGQIQSGPDGTNSTPAYSFRNDVDTGMYLESANTIGFASAGVERLKINNLGASFDVPITGTVGAQNDIVSFDTHIFMTGNAIIFGGSDTASSNIDQIWYDDGSYGSTSGVFTLVADGTLKSTTSNAGLVVEQFFGDGIGAAGAPVFTFYDDNNTGIYASAADQLSISAGGAERLRISTIQTTCLGAFGVADSAPNVVLQTTATNNINIWFRDSSANNDGVIWYDQASDALGMRVYEPGGGNITANEIRLFQTYTQIDEPLRIVQNGSESEPSYSFTDDTDTGIYLSGTNTIAFANAGAKTIEISGVGNLDMNGASILAVDEIQTVDGGASDPSYTFTSDTDTGMYLDSAGTLGFAAGGNLKAIVSDNVGRTLDLFATTTGTAAQVWQEFSESNGTRLGYIGVSSAGSNTFVLYADQGSLNLQSGTADVNLTAADDVQFLPGGGILRAQILNDVGRTLDLFATTTGTAAQVWMEWSESDGTRLAYAGCVGTDDDDFTLNADQGHLIMDSQNANAYVRAAGDIYLQPTGDNVIINSTGGAAALDIYSTGGSDTIIRLYEDGGNNWGFRLDNSSSDNLQIEWNGIDKIILSDTTMSIDLELIGLQGVQNNVLYIDSDTVLYTANASIVFSLPSLDTSLTDIDHLWYSDSSYGSTTGVFTFVADGTFKSTASNAGVVAEQYFGDTRGTASAPVFTFYDDLNTGIFSNAEDELSFCEGGTEALRIDSNGRILIAPATTASLTGPAYLKIPVGSAALGSIYTNTGSTAERIHWRLGVADTAVAEIGTDDPHLVIQTTDDATDPGDVNLYGGNATSGNNGGSNMRLLAGDGSGSGFGGNAFVGGGTDGENNTGALITVGGGDTLSDAGGKIVLATGAGVATGADGGPMNLYAGDGAATGQGGTIKLVSGQGGSTSGNCGNVQAIGHDTSGSGNAGSCFLNAGNVLSGSTSIGAGVVTILAGSSLRTSGSVAGGAVTITAGSATSSSSGFGADVNVTAGNGGSAGGDINLKPGRDTGDNSVQGSVILESPASSTTAPEFRFTEGNTSGANYVSFKAANTLGGNTTYTWPTADGSNGNQLTTNGGGTLSWGAASDERLKTNIEDTQIGLDFIKSLRPVDYEWKEGDQKGRKRHGFIAQEVKETKEDFGGYQYDENDDIHKLEYNDFIAPLVKAMQELAEENKELRERIKALESKTVGL